MAITIEQQPSQFEPIGRDLIIVVSSNNTTEPKFKYVFDVYVNSVLKGRVLISQNNANSGVFNFRELCQDQLSPEIFCVNGDNVAYGFQPGEDSPTNFKQISTGKAQINYEIKIGESYAPSATEAPVIYPDLASRKGFLWLASLPPYQNYADDTTGLFHNASLADAMLSDRVRNKVADCAPFSNLSPFNRIIERVNSKSWRTLEVTNDNGTLNGNDWENIVYEAVKKDGTVLTHTFPVTQTSGFNTPGKKINVIPCGPANIEFLDNHITPADQPNTLGSLLDYYKIYLTDSGGLQRSVEYHFVWDFQCCGGVYSGKFETATIMWLNTRGGYDYFDFNMRSSTQVNVSKKQYRKVRGNYAETDGDGTIGDNQKFQYNTQERGLTDSQNYETRNWSLTSNWVFESDYWSLASLFSSSTVFLLTTLPPVAGEGIDYNAVSIPVNVMDSNFSMIQTNGKKPQTLKLKVTESVSRFLPNN